MRARKSTGAKRRSYIAEFEFHTARYVKLRDRLVGEPSSNGLLLEDSGAY